jgi:hypothetical protein
MSGMSGGRKSRQLFQTSELRCSVGPISSGADLSGANLGGANFDGADLGKANLGACLLYLGVAAV